MTKTEELRKAFFLGFMVSREGFNGEFDSDALGPCGVEAHEHTEVEVIAHWKNSNERWAAFKKTNFEIQNQAANNLETMEGGGDEKGMEELLEATKLINAAVSVLQSARKHADLGRNQVEWLDDTRELLEASKDAVAELVAEIKEEREPEKCIVCGGDEPCSHNFDRIAWPNAEQNWTALMKDVRVLAEQADCILADRGTRDFPDVDLPQYDKETKHFARAVLSLLAHCSKNGHNVAGAIADMVGALKGN